MNQLAVIDDLAARRREAARKAVATRRARAGQDPHQPVNLFKRPAQRKVSDAMAVYEREANSDSPDWHRVALALKQALAARPQTEPKKLTRPAAIASPVWPDYPVDHLTGFKVRNPTIVVTFADGEVVRAPAVSAKDKPVNIGRGLRIAIAYYQARINRRAGLHFWRATRLPGVPAITACICEETGEIFDAERCTFQTTESRRAQDWRTQHDRRRIEATPPRSK